MKSGAVRRMVGTAGLLLIALPLCAQVYPRWFLLPEEISCAGTAVGVALTGWYPDSTGGPAFQDAVWNVVRAEKEVVEGTREFFTAGDATAIMGADVRESVDSSRLAGVAATVKVLKLFTREEMTAVLVGTGSCELPGALEELVSITSMGTPSWTTAPPSDEKFVYAVGLSPPYYYESSSWREAERNARLELARSVQLTVRSRDRVLNDAAWGVRYDAVWDEALAVILHGALVTRRWRDPATGTFMVLVRKPK